MPLPKTKHPRLPTSLSRSFAVLLTCVSCQTQSNPLEENWYQIELCVFTNDDSSTEQKELWRHDISLAYPKQLVLLQKNSTATVSTAHELPEATELLSEHNDNTGFNGVQLIEVQPIEVQPNAALLDASLESSQNQPAAFMLLPAEEFKLNDAAKRIARSGKHRILRHIAWRQPIKSRRDGEHIALIGGLPYGDHFELEGSIKLFRERYLHIETNLWLSTFATNLGQETSPWPILPSQPYLEKPDLSDTDGNVALQLQDLPNFGSQFQAFLSTEYVVERVVTLQQRRKMRSKELHYLDHPLFGMLIEITPYKPTSYNPAPYNPKTNTNTKETVPENTSTATQ